MSNLLKDIEFKVYTPNLKKSTKDGRRLIRGHASTFGNIDRQGEIITRKALEGAAKDLLSNCTLFYEHKHSELPVGKILSSVVDDKGLVITAELSKAKFCDDIWTLIGEGILNSFSIGGRVLDGHDERDEDGSSYHVIDKLELFEVSVCGLPANPEAKFQLVKSFNSAIAEQIKKKEGRKEMVKKDMDKKIEVTKVEESKVEESQEVKEEATSEKVSDEKKEEPEKKEEKAEEAEKKEEVKKEQVKEEVAAKSDEQVEEAKLETEEVEDSKEADIETSEDKASEKSEEEEVEEKKEVEKTQDEPSLEEKPSEETVKEVEKKEEKAEEAEKSVEEKILDALALILEKLSTLDKKEIEEKKEEPEKKEEKAEEAEKKEDYECECLECGEVITSSEHCKDIKCPKCEGEMRRKDRPGVGKAEEVEETKVVETEVEKKEEEEEPKRKSIVVVPPPYDEKEEKTEEVKKTTDEGWKNLFFAK